VARSIRRALTVGTVITVAVSAAWAYSTVLTSAGSAPMPHPTGSPVGDYLQMAGAVTGSIPAMFAVDALIYAVCFTIAGLRRTGRDA
jgi:hypothetical protein